ncbi:MAG: radical SAM protein [Candidatus Coatesbacteria bacterium]|nr:radical SAM protein [Candidatus Coatesbacteria bacterium]
MKMGIGKKYSEIGAIRKDPGGKLNVLLVFPNSYFVGMSNLGFHTIYAALNSLDFVRCERAFIPERSQRGETAAPVSADSGELPSRFDVIAFSMSFENDYPNLVRFLSMSGIETSAGARSFGEPLVVAGGCAVSANPEPLAQFVDAFVIGDGEFAILELAEVLFSAKYEKAERSELLDRVSAIDGVYVPNLFTIEYGPDGTVATIKAKGDRNGVERRATARESLKPARTVIFTEDTEFGHVGLVEAVRGCPRACRFCMASYCNRPARFMTPQDILYAAKEIKPYRKAVGLLGSAVADHPNLPEILENLLGMGMGITVSSLRADRIDAAVLDLLRRGGQQTITIAPESGDENLRAAISKECSDDVLIEVAAQVASAGFRSLKLYFMVGLPGETMDEVEKIVSLVKRMKHGLKERSLGKRDVLINVSVASFVPKAQTPLQWEAMLDPSELARRIKAVKVGLGSTRGVSVHADVPKWAFMQAALSRGDRRSARLVSALAETDFDWHAARKMVDINPEFYAQRERRWGEILPWSHISSGVCDNELRRDAERYRSRLKGATNATG